MPTLKKSGKRNIASAVMKPPPEWPHIAALSMSIHGYCLREILHRRDLIRHRVVAPHRAVVGVVERLRPAGRAASVDRHDDEARAPRAPACRRAPRLNAREPTLPLCGPGYALLMIGYFLRRIEVRRHGTAAVEIRRAVGRLHLDRHRRLPARRDELRDVGLLERHDAACPSTHRAA